MESNVGQRYSGEMLGPLLERVSECIATPERLGRHIGKNVLLTVILGRSDISELKEETNVMVTRVRKAIPYPHLYINSGYDSYRTTSCSVPILRLSCDIGRRPYAVPLLYPQCHISLSVFFSVPSARCLGW